MTFRDLLSAMRRRWYIPAALILCAALLTLGLARDGGNYTTRTMVSFLLPAATTLSPSNGSTDTNVITFAGAVVQEANLGLPPARYSTTEAPYHGAGVREGALVELVNAGNQWVSVFNKADVEIHVVGRSFDAVESTQRDIVARVLSIADARQAALGVPETERISATVVPLTQRIEEVSPSRLDMALASAAMVAAALILAGWSSIGFDRMLSRRRVTAGPRVRTSTRLALEGKPS